MVNAKISLSNAMFRNYYMHTVEQIYWFVFDRRPRKLL